MDGETDREERRKDRHKKTLKDAGKADRQGPGDLRNGTMMSSFRFLHGFIYPRLGSEETRNPETTGGMNKDAPTKAHSLSQRPREWSTLGSSLSPAEAPEETGPPPTREDLWKGLAEPSGWYQRDQGGVSSCGAKAPPPLCQWRPLGEPRIPAPPCRKEVPLPSMLR